jgi:dTDP-4-amino-4,6-dideoxygalactose transaminase
MQRMLDAGITTRRGIMCAHREPAYADEHWRAGSSLHRSEQAQDRSLLLPLFPGLTGQEQAEIVTSLHLAVTGEATSVRAA